MPWVTRRVDVLATQPHYADHLAPVWERIPEERRGVFYAIPRVASRLPFPTQPPRGHVQSDNAALVAGHADLQRTGGRRSILMEHGCGQSYTPRHPGYAGGPGRTSTILFLCPNEYSAELNRQASPDARVVVCGSPRLEQLRQLRPDTDGRTVTFTWHWECTLTPETQSAWRWVSHLIPEVQADGRWRVLGSGHPRMLRDVTPTYQRWGVPVVAGFEEVLAETDVLVADNTSAMFDFAALGGRVVVLNPPWYRRHVEHGLRFWSAAGVGVQVDSPEDLLPAIADAFADPPNVAARRAAAVAEVHPSVPDPAGLAAQAIVDALDDDALWGRVKPRGGSGRRYGFPGRGSVGL